MVKPFGINKFRDDVLIRMVRSAEIQIARTLVIHDELDRLSSEGKISSMSFDGESFLIKCPAEESKRIMERLAHIERST